VNPSVADELRDACMKVALQLGGWRGASAKRMAAGSGQGSRSGSARR
jgi:hypothetical protein